MLVEIAFFYVPIVAARFGNEQVLAQLDCPGGTSVGLHIAGGYYCHACSSGRFNSKGGARSGEYCLVCAGSFEDVREPPHDTPANTKCYSTPPEGANSVEECERNDRCGLFHSLSVWWGVAGGMCIAVALCLCFCCIISRRSSPEEEAAQAAYDNRLNQMYGMSEAEYEKAEQKKEEQRRDEEASKARREHEEEQRRDEEA